jgi:colanic acid/amylovoran biosynthesis glycosyltransferase
VIPQRRLAYVLKRFPRISETFIAAELIELERQGEPVVVFAISRPDEPFQHRFLDELQAPVIYLPHRPLREPSRVLRALGRVVRADARRWLTTAASWVWPPRRKGVKRLLQATVLRDEMDRAGIDHAHAHFATAASRLANLAWRMGGPSYSVTAHAKDIYHEQVRVDHLREKLAAASFVRTVSRANRDYLDSLLGLDGSLRVVPNSVDLGRLGPPRGGPPEPGLVLTVARLIEKKGIGDLIDAFGVLRERSGSPPPPTGPSLEVVGEGPMRAALEKQAAELGVDARFRGALPQEEVLVAYRRAAVFCLPCVVASTGDRDGLPTSVLEAMAVGVPVISTAIAGLAEAVIDERTGLVVPARDPPALADAIERLLADPELAVRIAAAGRQHVERRFNLVRAVTELRSLFGEVR